MALLTQGQLAAVREVSEAGMTTVVTILRRSEDTPPAEDYGDDYLDYTPTSASAARKVKGWFRSIPATVQDVDTGAIVTTNTYRLLLPVGTDILPGDQVTVGSDEYTVSDTNAEGTWMPSLRCNLRRRE